MKKKDEAKVEQFIENFERLVDQLEYYSKYLQLGEATDELRKDAIAILQKKVKKMKKAETEEDLKKHLKLKKITERK